MQVVSLLPSAMGTGAIGEADGFVADARVRLRRVHDTLKAATAPRPRVAVIECGDPLYAAGHSMPDMVKRGGGVDVLAEPGAPSVVVTLEQLQTADPEVIVIAPCGCGLGRAPVEGRRLLALERWRFARRRRVFALHADACASRPGPRLVDGVEILARLFNPTLFTPVDPLFVRALTGAGHVA